MAQITVQGSLDGTTTKSVLTINERTRTSTNTTFALNFKTNFVYSGGFIGSGEALNAIVQISATGMTTQTKNVVLKASNESWSGTTVHSKDETFVATIPSNVTNVTVKYTVQHTPSSQTISSATSLALTKLISQLNPFQNNALLNLEEELMLSITQYDSSYTNNLVLYYRDGNNLTELSSWDNVTDAEIISLTEEQINLLYELTTNNKFYGLTWVLSTFNGSTKLGEMQLLSTGVISNAEPIFSDFQFKDVNQNTVSLTGNNLSIIKDFSTLQVTIPVSEKAIAQKGATITSYLINDVAKNYSSTEDVVAELNNYSSRTIRVTAVDSRGNSTSIDKEFDSFIEYNPIEVASTSATISRKNDSDEETKISFNGNFWNNSFGDVNNSLSVSYKYRLLGSSGDFTNGTTTIVPVINENNYSISDKSILGDTDSGFNTSNSYEIVVEIEDKLSINEIVYSLNPGVDAIVIKGNKVLLINNEEPVFGGKKHCITLISNATQSFTANKYTEVDLKKEIKVGDKLYSDLTTSRIYVGAGVNHVLASYHLQGQTQARAWTMLMHKNSAGVMKNEIVALGYSPTDYFTHWDGSPRLFEVEEGDYFYVTLNPNSTLTLNQSINYTQASYMTVEVID